MLVAQAERPAADPRPQLVKIIRIEPMAADVADGIFPLVELQGHVIDLVVFRIVGHDIALKILGIENNCVGDVTDQGIGRGDAVGIHYIRP